MTAECPVHQGGQGALTIKANALAFLETGESELDGLSPEDIPMPRLRLEVNSMAAIIQDDLKHYLFSEATQDFIVKHVLTTPPPSDQRLRTIGEVSSNVLRNFLNDILHDMADHPTTADFMERTNHYRAAYFRRSPAANYEEEDYGSLETLIGAGIAVTGQRVPEIIFSIDKRAKSMGIGRNDRVNLIRNSGHMAILLAKLGLADFMRYSDMLQEDDFSIVSLALIDEKDGNLTAHLAPRLFSKMREIDTKDRSRLDHRERTGCAGTIDLDGTGSPLALGYKWFTGIALRTGYWPAED
jgi:hypothetical protein